MSNNLNGLEIRIIGSDENISNLLDNMDDYANKNNVDWEVAQK